MQDSRRTERVNVLLRQTLSEIIARDMKDPRLGPIITIIRVDVSRDLRRAKVYTSILGSPEEGKAVLETLNGASGFLRRELIAHLSLRTIPHMSFIYDNSIEKGTHLLSKITEVRLTDSLEKSNDE